MPELLNEVRVTTRQLEREVERVAVVADVLRGGGLIQGAPGVLLLEVPDLGGNLNSRSAYDFASPASSAICGRPAPTSVIGRARWTTLWSATIRDSNCPLAEELDLVE